MPQLDLGTLSDKPVIQTERVTRKPSLPIQEIAENWIGEFDLAIRNKNSTAVTELFQNDGGVPCGYC